MKAKLGLLASRVPHKQALDSTRFHGSDIMTDAGVSIEEADARLAMMTPFIKDLQDK